jgi:tRNA dimethylallyltransferase
MQSSNKPPLVLVLGPTAVGKTGIALDLAVRLQGEIVCADSRVFYRGMDIGTAKPSREQQALIRHHLIDIAAPHEVVTLAQYQRAASDAIASIQAAGRLPMLVGGTGQYIRAVTEGWTPPEVAPDSRLRAVLERLHKERGRIWLHEKLARLDPVSAARIDPRNVRRTMRAVEVLLTTGRRFSDLRGRSASAYHLVAVGLTRPRPELYGLIDARINAMFDDGLLEEVRGLLAQGVSPTSPAMSAIGYGECVDVLGGRASLEQAKASMRRATRLFVRRQSNWFKESDPGIKWFNVEAGVVDQVEDYLRRELEAQGIDSPI